MSTTSRGRLYVLLPLLLLGLDLLIAPKVSGHGEKPQPLNAVRLLVDKQLRLGAFRTHRIAITFDSIADPHYLAFVADANPNALVVSTFVDPDERETEVVIGAFAVAVFQKLKQLAPEEERKLREFIEARRGYRPGDVRNVELHLDTLARKSFPIDHIFLATLAQGTGKQNEEQRTFERVMTRVFERTHALGVRNIVIPVIGYNRDDKNAVDLQYFFRSLFAAMQPSSDPATVWVDLYSEWPTATFESVVASLNAAISQTPADSKTNRFYRQRVRGLYLLLTLCLLSTSFVIRLTWKAVAMIALAFTVAYLGVDTMLEPFLADLSGRVQLIIAGIVYVALGALFPIVIRWDPRNLFKKRGRRE